MERYIQQVKLYFDNYDKKAIIALRIKNSMIVASLDKKIEIYDLDDNTNACNEILSGIFKKKKDINAIIISKLKYTTIVSQTEATIPPLLDDLAQIVGPSVKCAKTFSASQILKKLSGRNACMIAGSGALAVGRTLDEANTTTMVLEKGAKSFIESSMIGGTKPISKFESILMHIIYKKKYSKIDQTNKLKEMQND